jgi:hypothetical protein
LAGLPVVGRRRLGGYFLNFFIFLFFRAKDPRVYKYPVPHPALYQKQLLAYEHGPNINGM